jgi:hypothetical protein
MHWIFAQASRTEVMAIYGPHRLAMSLLAPEFAKPLEHILPRWSVWIINDAAALIEQSFGQFFLYSAANWDSVHKMEKLCLQVKPGGKSGVKC